MRRLLILLPLLALVVVMAQEQEAAPADGGGENRIIRIEMTGGSTSGNIRYGPIQYQHPDPEGVSATVSNLTIFAQQAILRVPEALGEIFLSDAQGQREALFEGGVRVERGRLEASGPTLDYSEATGLGVLTGGADIEIAPSDEADEPTRIVTDEVEFDVDTDRSVSRGNVELTNGNQTASADTLTFAEDQDLGLLLCEGRQCTITRTDDNGDQLVIDADEIRVLTEQERLYARGSVTVVDADITSTGNEVFFDDTLSLAEVIGTADEPARSVDAANGVTITADRIRQDIEFDFVEQIVAGEPSQFDLAPFQFVEESSEAAGE